MDSLAKSVFTSKVNSVTDSVSKGFGFGDEKKEENEAGGLTLKEARKIEEKEKAEKAKRQQVYAKRSEERQKKRDEIRAKYGLSNEKNGREKTDDSANSEEKSCIVM